MTGTRNPQQDGSIQAMLRDSGLEAATELRSTLEQLQALVPERAPALRADLAALLAAGSASVADGTAQDSDVLPAGVSSLADRRRGRRRRMALVGGAVVGAMTLGAGAVAASSQDFRENVGHTIDVMFQPAAPTSSHAPAPTQVAIQPAPDAIPAIPAVPVPAGTSTPAPPSPSHAPDGSSQAPGRPGAVATPPAVGRGGALPTPPQRPVVPGQHGKGLPGGPLPTVPSIPELPTTLLDR
ncbi:hypothetical protein AB4Y86_03085 [Arthrobacter sp. 2YAF22_2]|uniref:hypothetical protein n=1 Tax=Arthrobacter sp. 2YAF22_2 TaxID=3233029 RepID=UPI003F907363